MARLLRMPEVAANAVEAVLQGWPIAENTAFAAADVIATIETEKAVVDVEAEADGVILRTLVPEGAEVRVGAPIAVIGEPGERVSDIGALLVRLGVTEQPPTDQAGAEQVRAERVSAEQVQAGGVSSGEIPTAQPPSGRVPSGEIPTAQLPSGRVSSGEISVEPIGPAANGSRGRVFASPLARRLAKEAGIPVGEITGTGPGGRIIRRDVEAAITGRDTGGDVGIDIGSDIGGNAGRAISGDTSAPVTDSPVTDSPVTHSPVTPRPVTSAPATHVEVPHSRIRKAVAARLTESKQTTPHFYLRGTARAGKLVKLRRSLNDGAPVPVSLNDLVVKAAARAHTLVPAMNVIWTPDAVRSFSSVDVAVAVATGRGLVTPVLRSVERMPVTSVATAMRDYVERAGSGRLRQGELEGGAFTVTNLGMFGTEEFAAIINPPQSAILAVGAVREEPIARNGRTKVAKVIRVTLSVDHRPIDGTTAAEWMRAFLHILEHPVQILV
jgi:pyruvate dehydrogenase E2 component (dihydrolipoamide acetyltransferase)